MLNHSLKISYTTGRKNSCLGLKIFTYGDNRNEQAANQLFMKHVAPLSTTTQQTIWRRVWMQSHKRFPQLLSSRCRIVRNYASF